MRLLIAIDLSDATAKVMAKAEEIAKALAAKVWLLHVAAPEPAFVGLDVGPQTVRDSLSKELHQEHRQIQEIADRLRAAGLDTTALLVQGVTADTILEEAAKLTADIIVVGSRGKGALQQLVVGSVSEGVLRKSECPVLVVPTH